MRCQTEIQADSAGTLECRILASRDSPVNPQRREDLHLILTAMGLCEEPDPRVRALRYWLEFDPSWYQHPSSKELRASLPTAQQRELSALAKQRWRDKDSEEWSALLRRIAQDQEIFRAIRQAIDEVGTEEAGVGPTSPHHVAQERYGIPRAKAREIYVAYNRQASILRGEGCTHAGL
jgi:hypothetical protein